MNVPQACVGDKNDSGRVSAALNDDQFALLSCHRGDSVEVERRISVPITIGRWSLLEKSGCVSHCIWEAICGEHKVRSI